MNFIMLPEFLSDVSVNITAVPAQLKNATSRGVLWQAAPGHFMIDVPETARYLVEEGKRVTIDPLPSADETDVYRFLRMTPLAATCFQRGIIAFHAAAITDMNGAVLIAGDSGAGKSTLLAAMLNRGWHLLSDDLAAVDLDESAAPVVFPSFPEMSLWSDAMEKLKMEGCGAGRHVLSMENEFIASSQPLQAIYRLSVHHDGIAVSNVEGVKRFDTLTLLSYNTRIADALFDRTAYMRLAAAIARNVPMRSLRRPRNRWCVEELADIVEGNSR